MTTNAELKKLEDIVVKFIRSDPRRAITVIDSLPNEGAYKIYKEHLLYSWNLWRREDQNIGIDKLKDSGYGGIFVMCGRGWGKTRTLSERIRDILFSDQCVEFGVICKTSSDAKNTNINGLSGLFKCIPSWERQQLSFNGSDLTVTNRKTGTRCQFMSAERPENIRGKNWHMSMTDELCKFQYGMEVLNQMSMATRIGGHPFQEHYTTPMPTPAIKYLNESNRYKKIRKPSTDNKYLGKEWFEDQKRLLTSRMYRQEILAELLEDSPGALFKRKWFDDNRIVCRYSAGKRIDEIITKPEDIINELGITRIVIAVDPSIRGSVGTDETGIIVAGLRKNGVAVVLEDATASPEASPAEWCKQVEKMFDKWGADRVIAERNQGGDMIKQLLEQTCSRKFPITTIHAKTGKSTRAEPVAALYENGEVSHYGDFAELESQMCEWEPAKTNKSPDRLDALVYAITNLLIDKKKKAVGIGSMVYGK